MPLRRLSLPLLLALAALLLAATPVLAGGFVDEQDGALRFTGEASEPNNVTISQDGDVLVLDEDASRMTAAPGCTVSGDGYHVECPALGIARIVVQTSDQGSDVRIRADLPAEIHGGTGDDVLIGGPGDDVIDGGPGQDVIGGGPGADVLTGDSGADLVTYADRIGADGELLPRHGGVDASAEPGASGAPGEGDTIGDDVEQVEGTAGDDRFDLRDGRAQSIACDGGHDLVIADPRDDAGIDCETTRVAPAPSGPRMKVPTLVFPFTHHADRGNGQIDVGPRLPLQHGAIVVRVRCPVAVGLLATDGPGCTGKVRFARGGTVLDTRRVEVRRGRSTTLKLRLTSSRGLARRASGLAMTVTALPSRGDVRRVLHFTVRG
jgi:hypothetical protein